MKKLTDNIMSVFPEKFLSPTNVYNAWQSASEIMTSEKMLDAIFQMVSTDTANWIVENLNNDYCLELPQFEDEDEDEDECDKDDDY